MKIKMICNLLIKKKAIVLWASVISFQDLINFSELITTKLL